ncbi:MAG: F0F1 ATP synthase subunit B family protein [Candidatus Nucleicultricaceae bacterium]
MNIPDFLISPEFWVFLAFVSFFGLLGKKIWTSLLHILDQRAAHIKDTLLQAETLRHEAEVFLNEQKRLFDDADKQAQQIIEYAVAEAENIKKDAKQKALHFMENQERILEQKISRLEVQITEEIKKKLIAETILEAESLMMGKPKEESQKKAYMDKALSLLENMDMKNIAS